MKKISPEEIKSLFIKFMQEAWDFKYSNGNPFSMNLGEEHFVVYLKNLASAHLTNPDVTRIQLKADPVYDNIPKGTLFVALGYDAENNVFVSWNPFTTQGRINTKANVSLYSRRSLQESCKRKEFSKASLTNGSQIVVFKENLLHDFFRDIQAIFLDEVDETQPEPSSHHNVPTKLERIEDKELLKEIRPLLKGHRVLEAATLCHKRYSKEYSTMKLKDWLELTNELYLEYTKQ